jgi:hypothetical protein
MIRKLIAYPLAFIGLGIAFIGIMLEQLAEGIMELGEDKK